MANRSPKVIFRQSFWDGSQALVDDLYGCNHRLVFRINGSVIILNLRIFAYRVNNIHPICHCSKGCVLSIKVSTVLMHNKKLGAGAIIILGTCHRNHAPGMGDGIFYAIFRKLALYRCI